MRVTLDYRTPDTPPGTVVRVVQFAVTLVGLIISILAPLAVTLASIYLNDPFVILAGSIVSGLCLALAFLLAAAAVEQFCELCD